MGKMLILFNIAGNWWCCQATSTNNKSKWWCCHATPATPDNYRAVRKCNRMVKIVVFFSIKHSKCLTANGRKKVRLVFLLINN